MNSNTLQDVIWQLPEYLRSLTFTIAARANSDPGLALSTLLSGMATAVHGGYVVSRPDGGFESLALFQIVLSGRTTGKTETHRLVHAAHKAHDVLRYKDHSSAKAAGRKLRLREVVQPLTSSRALLESLEGVGHATAISAHDGNSVLNSHLFRQQLDIANVLWDGDDKVTLPLPNGERLVSFNASLNLLLMVQPEIFAKHLHKHGEVAREIGFLARCLFTIAPDGSFDRSRVRASPGDCLAEYYDDVSAYLDVQRRRLDEEDREREVICFSPTAQALWFRLKEDLASSGFQNYWIQDAANRAMQNVARVAGVIHRYYPRRSADTRIGSEADAFAEDSGAISAQTLRAAWAIVQWNLAHFAQIFPPPALQVPPPLKPTTLQKHHKRIVEDAETIMLHFALQCRQACESDAPKSAVVMRSGLYPLRFNAALVYLTDQEQIVVEGEGRRARLRLGARGYRGPSMLSYGSGVSI